jgi:hypothetical protein
MPPTGEQGANSALHDAGSTWDDSGWINRGWKQRWLEYGDDQWLRGGHEIQGWGYCACVHWGVQGPWSKAAHESVPTGRQCAAEVAGRTRHSCAGDPGSVLSDMAYL